MKIGASAKQVIGQRTKRSSAFRVVLIYEDYLAGRCAMDLYEALISRFDDDLEFETNMWRFDALEGITTIEEATRDAIQADAVIVATYQRELPRGVRRWIDAWLPHKRGQKAALIAFLQADVGLAALEYLEEAAARSGLDFFATNLNRREIGMPPGNLVYDAWGLNE